MIDRLLGTLAVLDRIEVLDKFAAQKTTQTALGKLDEIDKARFGAALAARRKAIMGDTFPGDTPAPGVDAPRLLSARLAILAGEELYRTWLRTAHGIVAETVEETADAQRGLFNVQSRSQIDGDKVLSPIVESHISEFYEWRRAEK